MGRKRDSVRNSFKAVQDGSSKDKRVLDRMLCQWCKKGTVSNSVTRMKDHLSRCDAAKRAGVQVVVTGELDSGSLGGMRSASSVKGKRSVGLSKSSSGRKKARVVIMDNSNLNAAFDAAAEENAMPVPNVPVYQDDKVTGFELFKVPPRWLFLKVRTKNGFVGWGEPNVEGFSDTVAAAVKELMRSVVGQDPSRIQYIYQKMRRQKFYSGGPILMSAIAGIDQALWDIAGKTLGVPIHRMLGGAVRDRLRVYRWIGGDEDSPVETALQAVEVLQKTNYKQIKMNACPRMGYIDSEGAVRAAVERVRAVREAVGTEVSIGLDFHGRVKLPMCKTLMSELDRFNPLFYEEPVCEGQNASLKELASSTSVPLATGERMYTIEQFRELFETRAVSIVQPDCSHAGGISQMLSIARLAEAYEVTFAPHCPLGPIALASCLHVDACAVNFSFQETCQGLHYNEESQGATADSLLCYLNDPTVFQVDEDGFIPRLGKCVAGSVVWYASLIDMTIDKPGLGIEINENAVRQAAEKYSHDWQDREWTLEDGTPTTW